MEVAKGRSQGFRVQGSYTWGKRTDRSSGTVAGDAFGNSISSLNWFDMKLTRGPSHFNVGRTLVVNGTWDIPTAKSFSGPARCVTDASEIGLILILRHLLPLTPPYVNIGPPLHRL